MTCDDAACALAAAVDGELGVAARLRLARHVRGCGDCGAALHRMRADRAQRRAELPRHAAPAALVARLAERYGGEAPAASPRASRRRWLVAGMAGGCAATLAGTFVFHRFVDARDDASLARAAVAAHVDATLGDALVQVASDDRHTVKPWLSSRLDYAPPVTGDVAGPAVGAGGDETGGAASCRLAGARVDVVDRRTAVLVYRYRAHVVDVFVWPEADGRDGRAGATTIRGFNVREGRGRAMRWLAVSDVDDAVLRTLMDALTR